MSNFIEIITSQSFNNAVLSFTLLAIIWYSYETMRMKQELVAQRKFKQRPVLIVYRRIVNYDNIFRIRNIGRGVAFNVKIQKIKLRGEGNLTFEMGVYEPNILIPKEERDLEGQAKLKNLPILEKSVKSLAVIDPKYAKKNFIFKITYEDIEGHTLFTEIETLEDGAKVKRIGWVHERRNG